MTTYNASTTPADATEDRGIKPAAPASWRIETALAITGMTVMGLVQPVLDLLSKNAGFLTAHGLEGRSLLAFVLVLGLVVPVLLSTVFVLLDALFARRTGRSSLVSRSYAAGVLLVGAAALAVQALIRIFGGQSEAAAWFTVSVSVLAGALAAWLVLTKSMSRQLVALFSLGVIVFPALFLLANPQVGALLSADRALDPQLEDELKKQPIVMVLFDELPVSTLMTPDQQLDHVRFPNFHALAQTSTWYRRAVSAAETTAASAPSVVTGNLPVEPLEPVFASYPSSLFSWLGAGGYELFAVQNHTRLCPPEMCSEIVPPQPMRERLEELGLDLGVVFLHLVVPKQWASRLPAVDQNWKGFWRSSKERKQQVGLSVSMTVDRFLEVISRVPKNRLYYLHPNLPHLPWKFVASGKEYGPIGASITPNGLVNGVWGRDEWQITQAYQQHILQSQYADRVLGQLIDRLREVGIWDQATVVVASDHGSSFWPGESRRFASDHQLEDILEVPMFIKKPGQRTGSVDDRPTQTLDLMPTIAELLGARLPWSTDGKSLLQEISADRERHYARGGRANRSSRVIEVSDERRARTLERKHRVFGSGADSLVAIGDFRDLVGLQSAPLVGGESPVTYTLVDRWALETVDRSASFLPVRVSGSLSGLASLADPERSMSGDTSAVLPWLAIANNGTVRAVTRAFVDPAGRARFAAMLHESDLLDGTNRVEVYHVEREAAGSATTARQTRLRKLSSEVPHQVTMLGDGDFVAGLELPDNEILPIIPRAVPGRVNWWHDRINGWIGHDLGTPRAYDELFLFLGDQLLYRGQGDREPNKIFPVEIAGFRLELSQEALRDPRQLRLFARIGSLGSEITTKPRRPRLLAPVSVIREDGRRLKLNLEGGGVLEVVPEAMVGNIRRIEVVAGQLQLEGWAAESDRKWPAVSLVAMLNGAGYRGSLKRLMLPEIAQKHGVPEAGPVGYGFQIAVPLDVSVDVAVPLDVSVDVEPVSFQLFAVASTGVATELLTEGESPFPVVQQLLANEEIR